jgi:Fe-S-cluster-containing dehydrogenase component/CheY-like chemotaxis protein
MAPIRVLLADDHTVLRDSLRAFLGMYPDIEIVGEAADGVNTLAQVQMLKPDVLLLDMAMPNLGGLEVLRRIAKEQPDCKVLVLTQHDSPQYVLPALQAGAKGYLLKKSGGSEVAQAVRAIARGESILHPAIARFVIDAAVQGAAKSESSADALTERAFVPHLCMQCDNPTCLEACPTGATYKTAEGIVMVNQEKCIDCKYCIAACPYGARYEYNDADRAQAPAKTFVDKCTFCAQRLKEGREPACVATCLAGARIFGDLGDPKSQVAQLVASGKAQPLAPETGTKPKVFYIGWGAFAATTLPVNVAAASLTQVWENEKLVGSLALGAVAVGAAGVFAYARKNAQEHFAQVAVEMQAPPVEKSTAEKE